MKSKVFLRPSIAIVFGFIGAYVARGGTPPEIFAIVGEYFIIVAFLSFATLGFILPDVLELAGRAGINALAKQLAELIPDPRRVSNLRIRRRVSKSKKSEEAPIVVDTSALIDGRVLDVVKSGFMWGKFIVLPSVVSELHKLADNYDEIKRGKGRRGLDVLRELQRTKGIKIELIKRDEGVGGTDEKLVDYAKKIKSKLMTVDFNLAKVAKVRGVDILNINELANALKTAVLPNDTLNILISAKGKEKGQGVGYLGDGTMVVVEDGEGSTGKNVSVKVKKVIQTNAGKMIFAKRLSAN